MHWSQKRTQFLAASCTGQGFDSDPESLDDEDDGSGSDTLEDGDVSAPYIDGKCLPSFAHVEEMAPLLRDTREEKEICALNFLTTPQHMFMRFISPQFRREDASSSRIIRQHLLYRHSSMVSNIIIADDLRR